MRRQYILTVTLTLVVGSAAALMILLSPDKSREVPAPPERKLVWDLSRQPRIDEVSWPGSVEDEYWFIDEPTEIEIVAPGGHRREYYVHSVTVEREGGKVLNVRLGFPNQTLDEARDTAGRVGAAWHLSDPTGLTAWHKARRIDGGNTSAPRAYEYIRNDVHPARSLAVRPTYSRNAPWFVSLSIDFREWTDEQLRTIGQTKPVRGE